MKSLSLEVEHFQIENSSEFQKISISQCWNAWVSIIEKNIENSVGAKSLPLPIGISPDNLPFMITLTFIPLCNCFSIFTNISNLFSQISSKVHPCWLSKALVELIWYRRIRCSYTSRAENIMLIVPMPYLKWLCHSAMTQGKMFQNNRFSKKEPCLLNLNEWFRGSWHKFLFLLCPCTNTIKYHQPNYLVKHCDEILT